ncbi:MAG: tripartite tricarboxylate transporter substrate binding protein [Nitrospinaceae bacterium]|jgi:tripartite-type tricarboxylate transporter receptor subunit TctC|nr:tripartite tricarboxylate transporter substrate binding protein [Nitrospinaceae bacterium]MBT3434314.1 tripartite tricarboxylate transporter substrate binding protein [Nitrospinaceae bacterium]MBT4092747.1 tripartite tricarboxylate transporter substrate binding protein [Nitrospinaceae bacterium]MBT5368809.1 tripartite tricarboxylate transporter substrate binding protein [Nitrospinaceae bacterium]MBT5949400.1 tripartite tricarboxylate transporter substrate binding protein [Nitrospinaceae bact
MKRFFVFLFAIALLAPPLAASADEYPNRPITLVLPVGAGGSHDLHARGITSIIADILGQPMIVKLLPGGAAMKGTGYVAKAKPDGYTILFSANQFDMIVPQTRKVPFNTLKDFKTIAKINHAQPMFISLTNKPWKNMKELIAYAKKNPGKINWGHSGVWGAGHIPSMQLVKAAGIKVNFIPHKGGGPALRALLSGQDDVGMAFPTQARSHAKAGKIRALVITGDKRLSKDPVFRNVPTAAEIGYKSVSFQMERIFMAPSKIPADHLTKLRLAFVKLMKNKSFKRFMRSIGESVTFVKGEEYDKTRPQRYKEYTTLIKSITGK